MAKSDKWLRYALKNSQQVNILWVNDCYEWAEIDSESLIHIERERKRSEYFTQSMHIYIEDLCVVCPKGTLESLEMDFSCSKCVHELVSFWSINSSKKYVYFIHVMFVPFFIFNRALHSINPFIHLSNVIQSKSLQSFIIQHLNRIDRNLDSMLTHNNNGWFGLGELKLAKSLWISMKLTLIVKNKLTFANSLQLIYCFSSALRINIPYVPSECVWTPLILTCWYNTFVLLLLHYTISKNSTCIRMRLCLRRPF